MKVLLEKTYSGESICDIYRDVSEAVDADYNPDVKDIPQYPGGIQKGSFKVKIEWTEE